MEIFPMFFLACLKLGACMIFRYEIGTRAETGSGVVNHRGLSPADAVSCHRLISSEYK